VDSISLSSEARLDISYASNACVAATYRVFAADVEVSTDVADMVTAKTDVFEVSMADGKDVDNIPSLSVDAVSSDISLDETSEYLMVEHKVRSNFSMLGPLHPFLN
jgi:hypothetical protein